jgi:serine/threonine-protein kinase
MTSQAPVVPGQILAGKYRVDRVLGLGGMGVVVAATHVHLDERVAIKFLLPEALESADTVARFAREARAAVKIKNEHVARVSDVGALEDGTPYMVMEYLDGRDLSALLLERGPLPVSEAVDYLLQGMEAIAEAHSLGIVHRDIKPSNLFLTRSSDGRALVKVLDFGISKVSPQGGMAQASLTRTSSIMGSPLYMAPEQMVSTREVDARADVWALGVVLYELLARHAPFLGESMTELCARILQEPPAPLRLTRPDVAPELENVILRALQKDRSHRFANVGDLAVALGPFAPPHAHASIERIVRLVGGAAPASYAATALGAAPHGQITPLVSQVPVAPVAPAGFQTPPPYPAPAPPGYSTQASWGHTSARSAGGFRWVWVGVVGVVAVLAGVLFGIVALVVRSAGPTSAADATSAVTLPTTTTPTKAHPLDDPPLAPLSTASATAPADTHATAATPPIAKQGRPPASATTLRTPTSTATTPPPPATTTKRPDIF